MAGDWIPVRTHLIQEPEIGQVATATGRTPAEVIGFLVLFWSWMDAVSTCGRVAGGTIDLLIMNVGADEIFWRKVSEIRWISFDNGISMPRFNRWLSKSAKTRLNDSRRKRIEREALKEKSFGHSTDIPRTFLVGNTPTEQYSTEQDRTEENTHTTPESGGACVGSAAPLSEAGPDPTSEAWSKALKRLSDDAGFRVEHGVRSPGAWIAGIRAKHPGKCPSEVPGLEWLEAKAPPSKEELIRQAKVAYGLK